MFLNRYLKYAKTSADLKPFSSSEQTKNEAVLRGILLIFILIAFGRLVWQLGAKNLWWDESLSLQRAEVDIWSLLRGRLIMYDGFSELVTIDQHPFLFFLLERIFLQTTGSSEFSLRFVSVMAATLVVPLTWSCIRYFVRHDIFLPSTPYWSAYLTALNAFFLWYGQEARPYMLWALFTLLSTYTLIRATEKEELQIRWTIGYGLATFLLLTTHYYAIFLLPVHIVILYLWISKRSLVRGIIISSSILMIGMIIGGTIAWGILVRGGGINFRPVSFRVLLPDLLNAFSLGISVDIDKVWWVDIVFGITASIGTLWAVRSWQSRRQGGWLIPSLMVVPILILQLVSLIHPDYMSARHLSLISGCYLMAFAGGIAVVWYFQKWLAVLIAILFLAGSGYSTINYFTSPAYDKKYDDYTSLGKLISTKLLPGDLLLLNPTFSWRIFRYYLPLDKIEQAARTNGDVAYYGVPFIGVNWEKNFVRLEGFRAHYKRIWLITSGTHPYIDPDGKVKDWLLSNMYLQQEYTFFSYSSLKAALFLPRPPVFNAPIKIDGKRVNAVFGNQIRLIGYNVGRPLTAGSALPITFYWQTLVPTDKHYKYILKLEGIVAGSWNILSLTEREPYDGAIPTIYWQPGQTIMEYSELPPPPTGADLIVGLKTGAYRLSVEIYQADTLGKMPLTYVDNKSIQADNNTLLLR